MTTHETTVVFAWPLSVHARCEACDWEGPPRDYSREAIADAIDHESATDDP